MAKIYMPKTTPAYRKKVAAYRSQQRAELNQRQTSKSSTSKRRTTPSKPRKTSVSIYGGTLPGSPAWQAEQTEKTPHQQYIANLLNPNRPAGQYPTHEAGRYTQAGQPSATAAQPATAPQSPYAPQQQPAYAPQQQPAFDYSKITGMFEESMAEANRANEARYQEGLGIHGQIADIYAPGGGFGAGHEAQLERTKTRDVASAQQQMVSSGLWGTTVAAAIPAAWEETVGQPSRLALQDVQMGRYGEALAGKAGFIERRSDVGPDMGLFAGLMQGAYAGPMSGGGGGQVGGQRYGTPPAGGGQVGGGPIYTGGRTGPPQPGAAPVPTQTPARPSQPQYSAGAGPGPGGKSIQMSDMARYSQNLRFNPRAAQSEYKKRQLKYGGRNMQGSTPQSSIYGKTASRPGWGRYS